MKINKFFREDHTVNLTVEIESEPFESAKRRAARMVAQRTRIPGFRPGKAPYNVVVRTVGEGAIVEQAIDLLLDELYPKIIEESEIKPYSAGKLNNILSLDPLTLEFNVPLEPVVSLPEYKNIRVPYELRTITEDEVNQILEDLRDRHATLEPVERPAQEGDQVSLRLRAERKSPEEGKELVLINDRQTVLTIKSQDDPAKYEWPFKGFSRYLIGLSAGDEKTFEYTYPEDSDPENLRGTEAVFYVKIEEVKERHLPELNDEFARQFGDYESLAKLREDILNNLEKNEKENYEREYQDKIIEEILKEAIIQYPPVMLQRELEYFKNQLENRLRQQNLDLPAYLKIRQMSEEDLNKELLPAAEQRLRRSLLLLEIAKYENIQIDDQIVQNETLSTLDYLHQTLKPEASRRIMTRDFIQNIAANISGDLLVKNTLDRLVAIAKGELEAKEETAKSSADEDAVQHSDQEADSANVQAAPENTAEALEENAQLPLGTTESETSKSVVPEKPTKKRKTRKEIE